MPAKLTSRLIPCWRALHADLEASTWPAHPVTSHTPLVTFGGHSTDAETIELPGRSERPSTSQWATIGAPGAQENFRLAIEIYADTDGQTALEALDRIEALSDVAQRALRYETTGLPAGDNLRLLLPSLQRWLVVDFGALILPGPEGFLGRASLDVEFDCRI